MLLDNNFWVLPKMSTMTAFWHLTHLRRMEVS